MIVQEHEVCGIEGGDRGSGQSALKRLRMLFLSECVRFLRRFGFSPFLLLFGTEGENPEHRAAEQLR
jgi:hypothetical protein